MSFLDGDSTEAVEMHYFTVYRIAMECVNFAADFLRGKSRKMHFQAVEFNKKRPRKTEVLM